MSNKVFVVSLPRTGTSSMSKMLNMLGYKTKHAPSCFVDKWKYEGYNAFADTPCYALSFIKEQSIDPTNKFIYIDRHPQDWIASFEAVGLHKSYERIMAINDPKDVNVVIINEIKSYGETFGFNFPYDRDAFLMHFVSHRYNISCMLKDRVLFYDFTEGWERLCEFLGKEIPSGEIPHLNNKRWGDKID